WVIPYADMLTLLMGIFVVLWAISSADLTKLEALQTSFAGSLGMSTTGESSAGGDGALAGTNGVLDGGVTTPPLIVVDGEELPAERAEQAVDALAREEQAAAARAAEDEQLAEVERAITAHAE